MSPALPNINQLKVFTMTHSHPVAGYLFPTDDGPEYNIDKIITELAAAEADYGTEAFDEIVDLLECLPEWEVLNRYAEHTSEY